MIDTPERHIAEDVYDIGADGEFMAAFTSNGEARHFIEWKINQEGWTLDRFDVKKNGQALSLAQRVSVSIGGQ